LLLFFFPQFFQVFKNMIFTRFGKRKTNSQKGTKEKQGHNKKERYQYKNNI